MNYLVPHSKCRIFIGFALITCLSSTTRAVENVDPVHHGEMQMVHQDAPGENATKLPAPSQEPSNTQFPPGTIGQGWPQPVEDSQWFGSIQVDELEYQLRDGPDTVRWDAVGWYGGDYNRLWIKTEGEWLVTDGHGGNAEAQGLYGRLIAPYWDAQVGVRYDLYATERSDKSRGFVVLGLEGLAPYWFEIEPAVFISQDGDVSARLTVTYELQTTQRLILQPRFDIDAAVQSVPEFGVGEGIDEIALGLRLRYEIPREVAPYIGLVWQSSYGETADLRRAIGEKTEDVAGVIGIRVWL